MDPELFRIAIVTLESYNMNKVRLHFSIGSIKPGNICILEEVLAPFLDHLQKALP